MKHKLLIGVIALVVAGCCDMSVEPGYPYGAPDNMTRSDKGGGAVELVYIYHCLEGEYVKVFYFRPDKCSNFQNIGEDRSEGRCP